MDWLCPLLPGHLQPSTAQAVTGVSPPLLLQPWACLLLRSNHILGFAVSGGWDTFQHPHNCCATSAQPGEMLTMPKRLLLEISPTHEEQWSPHLSARHGVLLLAPSSTSIATASTSLSRIKPYSFLGLNSTQFQLAIRVERSLKFTLQSSTQK